MASDEASASHSKPDGSRKRYLTLDGLRGVASLMVVLFHSQMIGTWLPRFGHLAVDLFFLLSGFVLAEAYYPRFNLGMGAREFIFVRVARLYPLYFLGLMLGLGTAFVSPLLIQPTAKAIGACFVANLFGLPSPPLENFQVAGGSLIFPLNIPFWSLFFEFWVANLIFVLLRNILLGKALFFLISACGLGLLITEKIFYTLSVGWHWTDFLAGFPRVGFSFFTGVFISTVHRSKRLKIRLPSWLVIISLPILLSVPLDGRLAHLYELACLLLIFPVLIYLGADAVERRPWVGEALGDASYAIYTIHFPLLIFVAWVLGKFAMQHSLTLQIVFVGALIPIGLVLSRTDLWVRKAFIRWATQRRWANFQNRDSRGASAVPPQAQ
jgi:peptidoglycan/LPS O-acetylase OafA/YrhL